MSGAEYIRDLGAGDAGALVALYQHLNAGDAPPSEEAVHAVFAHPGLRHFGAFDGEHRSLCLTDLPVDPVIDRLAHMAHGEIVAHHGPVTGNFALTA